MIAIEFSMNEVNYYRPNYVVQCASSATTDSLLWPGSLKMQE